MATVKIKSKATKDVDYTFLHERGDVIVNDDYYNEMDSLILADVDDLAHKFEEYRVCLETILDSGIVEGKTHDALRAFYDCVVKYRNNLCNDHSYGQMLDVELQKFLSDVDNDDKAMY